MRRSDGGAAHAWSAAASAVVVLTLVAALGLPLAPPALASPTPSPGPVDYRIGVSQPGDGLNPFSAWSPVSRECFLLGYDYLTWFDADYHPAPDIATSWELSEDGLAWTFHIREGMTWQDGEPLTARDVAFTYNLIRDSQEPVYSHYLTGVSRVEAPDDATVVITTRHPKADMLGLAIPILPEHIWKTVRPDELEWFDNEPFVGSGPFRVTTMRRGRFVRLEANQAYPSALGGRPSLDELTFVVEQDPEVMLRDYRSGALDAITDYPPASADAVAAIPGVTTVAVPAIGFHELGFNCWDSPASRGNPLLLDPSIRRAVHWAIDTKKLAETVMAGQAVPGSSLLSPAQSDWRWDVPEAAQYRYDPQRAKQILDDAGYTDGDADGVREDDGGEELSFRIAAPSEYPEDQAAARMIVRWCRDIGIRLRLEVKSTADISDDIYHRADDDLFIWSWGGDVDPGFILSTFTTGQIMDWSDTRYSDLVYDRLYEMQAEALDPAAPEDGTRRKELVDAMQKVLYRDDPSIVLWYKANLQSFRTETWTGYALAPAGAGAPFWNQLRTTYIHLRPLGASLPAPEASRVWVWLLIAALIAAGALVFALLRRRSEGGGGRVTKHEARSTREDDAT